jgi:hypothetical protein
MQYQTKDVRQLLAGRSLTPAEAWQRASAAQRRSWFGNEPPEPSSKASSPYAAPAAPVGLPPHLEAAVRDYQASHYADPICPRCALESKSGNAVNGRCPHRPGPAALAHQRQDERTAEETQLLQDAKARRLGTGSVRVVPFNQALQEDSLRAEAHAAIEEAFGAV